MKILHHWKSKFQTIIGFCQGRKEGRKNGPTANFWEPYASMKNSRYKQGHAEKMDNYAAAKKIYNLSVKATLFIAYIMYVCKILVIPVLYQKLYTISIQKLNF